VSTVLAGMAGAALGDAVAGTGEEVGCTAVAVGLSSPPPQATATKAIAPTIIPKPPSRLLA